jgi:hypothetical protein
MNNQASYSGQEPYTAAIWETNELLMNGRIDKALCAVEQRRLSPVEANSDEDRALSEAETGIQRLITRKN